MSSIINTNSQSEQPSNEIDLSKVAETALDYAKKLGMDQAEVSLHRGTGVSVTARMNELETVEKHNDGQFAISVYQDHKTGSASSADLTERGIIESVKAAAAIARYTGSDDCLGLAEKDLMADRFIDLQLNHPWNASVSELADWALKCEQAALAYDKRIDNSEGASVSSYSGRSLYANSHGFSNQRHSSQHSVSCSVIGLSNGNMQRDYWYDSNRNAGLLMPASALGKLAAKRTVERLDSRKIDSCQVPVMYEASAAKSLIGHLVNAIKGGIIYKKASFMLDKVGEQILPDFVNLAENPHILGGAGSANYDQEGVATPSIREILKDGVLQSYVLGSYTARKLGLSSTANAGGVRNLTISDTGHDFQQMLKKMDKGLLVTELIGSGINMVTGDYSRGAAGFWVENGEIQYPVEEITIAGNLSEMYRDIVAIGNDIDPRGNFACGSILLEKMTIAGS